MSIFVSARSPKVRGAMPGGQDRAFWPPAYAASTPHSSNRTGRPPILVTVSAAKRQSWLRAISPSWSMGWQAPVDVSAWATQIMSGLCSWHAASTSSGVNTSPQGFSNLIISAP